MVEVKKTRVKLIRAGRLLKKEGKERKGGSVQKMRKRLQERKQETSKNSSKYNSMNHGVRTWVLFVACPQVGAMTLTGDLQGDAVKFQSLQGPHVS